MIKQIKQAIDYWWTALKDPKVPDVEISDIEMLSVYLGRKITLHYNHSKHNQKSFIGLVIEHNDCGCVVEIGTNKILLTESHFENGLRCYPVR